MPFFDAVVKEVLEENDTLTLLARDKNKELMGLIMISSKTARCVRINHIPLLFYEIYDIALHLRTHRLPNFQSMPRCQQSFLRSGPSWRE